MLFEAFRQVDGSAKRVYEGTGLGLYLCRKLLSMMGGEISVTERIRQRVAFYILAALGAWSGSLKMEVERRKALLVEDNENNRYLLTLLLEEANISVVGAKNGHDALELARSERPDCVLLDIQMPEMDGYELATRLKADAELSKIPIIGVSSFAMPGDREKAFAYWIRRLY